MKLLKEIKFIVVHHTRGDYDSIDKIKEFHTKVRGWKDIGYHWVIGDGKGLIDGKLYKGRSEKFIGAHVKGFNQNSIGIVLVGNFDKAPPSKKQIETLIKFLKAKMKKYKISSGNILGHNETKDATKTCPGRFIDMNWIRSKLLSLSQQAAG